MAAKARIAYPEIVFLVVLVTLGGGLLIKHSRKDVAYQRSTVDGRDYLVRRSPIQQQAADMLAEIKQRIDRLVTHLNRIRDEEDYEEYRPYIDQLSRRIRGVVISESDDQSQYTSYSVNKGEEIVFCLRPKGETERLHSINLVMYVALHELAHVGCPEFGHTPLFKKIFAFLTQQGIEIGIYELIDFNRSPVNYCGLMITDSII